MAGRGDVRPDVAQGAPQFDAEIAEQGHLSMETSSFASLITLRPFALIPSFFTVASINALVPTAILFDHFSSLSGIP